MHYRSRNLRNKSEKLTEKMRPPQPVHATLPSSGQTTYHMFKLEVLA